MKIGKYIKQLRTEKKLSIRDLASKTELSAAAISLIERDVNSPTLASLSKICGALNIYLVDLLQLSQEKDDLIIRKTDRKQFTFSEYSNISYEIISNPKKDFKILAVSMEPKSDYKYISQDFPSNEIALVCEGKMEIVVNNQDYILDEGDTIYLEAGCTYKYRNAGDSKCVGIFVIQGIEGVKSTI
ncbi:helix-turn-helix domain-containing protein [Peribacillus butanolivorans]|uniref:helix-turn-helix domain-containing protein n=1 Tax=Peribacillus butanolivorans TaxID=421767 RepID=UPI00207D1D8C|nr:helix-turn-helix domain-containing protein [Peribacillus butanolivorans]MCO0599968.1 helix-turn-helix domain-containing protein [Peribacillus butanolivorans]